MKVKKKRSVHTGSFCNHENYPIPPIFYYGMIEIFGGRIRKINKAANMPHETFWKLKHGLGLAPINILRFYGVLKMRRRRPNLKKLCDEMIEVLEDATGGLKYVERHVKIQSIMKLRKTCAK